MMQFIYGLFSDQLCLYIGRTNNIRRREGDHKRRRGNHCGSCKIPKYIEWKLVVLETCDIKNRVLRERYYYDMYMPLYNQRRPGLNQQERDEMEVRECMFNMLRILDPPSDSDEFTKYPLSCYFSDPDDVRSAEILTPEEIEELCESLRPEEAIDFRFKLKAAKR